MMRITINGVDRTRLILATSVRITSVLTNGPDTASFTIRKFGDRTFAPTINHEVLITQDSALVFGGNIYDIGEAYGKLDEVSFTVNCIDYTKHMDQRLVVESYTSKTVNFIIADIRAKYMPKDIDIANVNVASTIDYIAFNYEYPSDCLRQLAEIAGADWYIDYQKKLFFFNQNMMSAPFGLTDSSGNYIYESLGIRRDLTQLRNTIFVRGGEFLANTTTAAYVSETNQVHFLLPYQFSDLVVTNTGHRMSVGVDPIDDPTGFDVLYNFQEKMVKFRPDRIRASKAVRISGRPYLPVLAKVRDPASIETFTAREYVVIDKSINSKDGARQRAYAELLAYKSTISEGEFSTYEDGLRPGQTIAIQSTLRGIDDSFIINRVDIQPLGTDGRDGTMKLVYKISLVTTRTYDFIQQLQKLINQNKKEIIISDAEIIDTVEAILEDIEIEETIVTSKTHNPITETVTLGESISSNKNFGTKFVLGPQIPTSTKRVFILDGSRLGT